MVSYCFSLFGEFAKVFERQVWRVQVTHFHNAARTLSSPRRCFQLLTNLDKDFFRYILCWDAATIFTNAKRLPTSRVFLQHREILHCEDKIDKEFWYFDQQNRNRFLKLIKESVIVILPIISAVFKYFQLSAFNVLKHSSTLNIFKNYTDIV